jgi:cystathionine beta-lyase/cystathionine gamma-synthase
LRIVSAKISFEANAQRVEVARIIRRVKVIKNVPSLGPKKSRAFKEEEETWRKLTRSPVKSAESMGERASVEL